MEYRFQYGPGALSLEIEPRRVKAVLRPKHVEELGDVGSAVAASLATPIDSPPLAELLDGRETVLIVTVNHTRPSPAPLLRPILGLCDRKRVRPVLCIANGCHGQMTRPQIDAHLGTDITGRYRVVQHDAFDRDACVHLGATSRGTDILVNKIVFEHDLVIGVGIIEPSYLCGWSGGRKLMMPGLAFHAAVDNNHYYLTHPDTRIGRLRGNPVSDDAEEFARAVPYHFITYSINGPNDEIAGVISGDPYTAHEKACEQSADIYTVDPARAPIVISSSGGHPYDRNLVQGKKAVVPATDLVQDGGAIILLAECSEGLGAEATFIRWLREKTPAEVVRDVMVREQFNLGAHGANILARPIVRSNAKVILVTCPDVARELEGSYVAATTRLEEAWETANSLCGAEADVVILEKARRLICRATES